MTADPRAEALRNLIERVEAGSSYIHGDGFALAMETQERMNLAGRAHHGSLDAVARLEAPLRERGLHYNVTNEGPRIVAQWWDDPEDRPIGTARAPTEARARLLAVLKALLHECEVPHAQR